MEETSKSKNLWGTLEYSILSGKGIDIGCGTDPVTPEVRRFDLEHGDANVISEFVKEEFDFVYASHCLEHMHDPLKAILEWWKLVRVGGYLFFMVPDEDLYEQGVFPSRFNPDHKATFTISKQASWSPVSINVLDLANSLPGGSLVRLTLQDNGYERKLMRHGVVSPSLSTRMILRLHGWLQRNVKLSIPALERLQESYTTVDQTLRPHVVAQIQCIVKKVA